MRSGGKGMWGQGPALYKQNYYIKIKKNLQLAKKLTLVWIKNYTYP